MHRNMRKSQIIYLLLLLTAVGCIREDLEAPDGSMRIELGARVDAVSVSTKAALDKEGTYDDLDINLIRWDEGGGDSPAGKEELPATMSGTPSNDGLFKRDIIVTPTQFFVDRTTETGFAGWYPAQSDTEGNPGANWELYNGSRVIHPADGTHAKPYMTYRIDESADTDVMVSDFVKGNYSSGIPAMEFRHALCKYRIHAYAVDEDTKAEWGKVTSITLTNLPDKVTILLPDDITAGEAVEFEYSDATHQYMVLGPDDQAFELHPGIPSETSLISVGTILGGAPTSGVLGISATTENQTTANSVSIARNFKPGYVYNIFLKFSSKGIINAEVSAMDWTVDDNEYIIDEDFDLLTDLSRYGTANSYIVSSANRGYCFDGTVKGNGDEGNELRGRNGQSIVLDSDGTALNVDHIGIVRSDALMMKVGDSWEPVPEDKRATTPVIELVSDKLSNGKVIFKVPGAGTTNPDGSVEYDMTDFSLQYKGNVKIAAYDAVGNIIWSWHIWITDKPINQGYSNGYVALDRNLGAVTDSWDGFFEHGIDLNENIAYTGLYYQWGRKDPFFPAPFNDGEQWEGVDGTVHPVYEDRRVSVDYAVQHPMTYFFDGSGQSNSWVSDADNVNSEHFWGYISMRDDIVKTIYDPCPPGYRVPGNPIWEDPSENMSGAPVTSNGKFAGYNFNIDGMIDIYYPCSSCIVSDAGAVKVKDYDSFSESSDNYVFLYSATPYEPDLYGRPDAGVNYDDVSYHFRYNEDAFAAGDYDNVLISDPARYHVRRSDAYPVRCVFEDSAPTVTDLSDKQTANSYNITSTGFYEFDATVRGNGVTTLNITLEDEDHNVTIVNRDFSAGLGATITGIDKVDVLWWQGDLLNDRWTSLVNGNPSDEEIEAKCPVTVLDGGSLVDGKPLLYIRVNDNTHGNVGLAAYDEFGNILWSWHLWLCPGIQTVQLGEYTLMDRNLGATYCPGQTGSFNSDNIYAGLGFYYQWGRKDPFFQPAAFNSATRATQPWFRKDYDGSWTLVREVQHNTGQPESIESSIRKPTSFFNVSGNNWQSTYTDADEQINDLWGYVGSKVTSGSSFAKTMYDPCPPGYRVMQHDVFKSANICEANYTSTFRFTCSNDFGIYIPDRMEVINANRLEDDPGTLWGTYEASSGGIWFPNSGALRDIGEFTGTNHRIATATPFAGTAMREIRWYRENTYDNTYLIRQDNSTGMAAGRVVRCQME